VFGFPLDKQRTYNATDSEGIRRIYSLEILVMEKLGLKIVQFIPIFGRKKVSVKKLVTLYPILFQLQQS